MKLPYKIALIVISAVLLTALLFTITNELSMLAFIAYYGLIGCGVGIAAFLVSLIIAVANKDKRSYTQGFVLSGGILLLTGIFALVYTFSQVEFGR